MDEQTWDGRLSQIATQWSVIFQAHQRESAAVTEAQRLLMQRYAGPVYRYLLGIARDPDVADDLAQEFALRFLRGDFHRVDPSHGRFRDFVKAALRHLAVDHRRRQEARRRRVAVGEVDLAALAEPPPDPDERFVQDWREALLARAWEALARVEEETGQPFHTLLRFRAEHPEVRSAQMAEQLSARLGKPLTAAGVRQTLHRARDRYADLLLDEVARSLERPGPEELADELVELNLLTYCRPALERRREG
jgi:RNA polymerase sigma factor (sigma-70 family)